MTRALLALALLVACDPYPPREYASEWTLDLASLPAPDGWHEAITGLRERAPCWIDPSQWGGVVKFTAEGFGRSADLPTWYPGDVPRALVAIEAGIPGTVHAGCHAAQFLCEVDPVHDAAFSACVETP